MPKEPRGLLRLVQPRVLAAIALLAAAAASAVTIPHLTSGAETTQDFIVTVSPDHNLVTGESITITVTRTTVGTSAGLEISSLETGWCTADPQLPSHEVTGLHRTSDTSSVLPDLAALGSGVHCTTRTHPLNADLHSASVIAPPLVPTGNYPSVSGVEIAQSTSATPVGPTGTYVLTCEVGNPCTLMVVVYTTYTTGHRAGPATLAAIPVTYAAPGATAACGGAAQGQLTTVAPDRLGQALTTLTIDACKAGLGGGRAVTGVESAGQGDAAALQAFAAGSADIAYSAVGYGTTPTFSVATKRPFVAVPIAINAVVLAHPETDEADNPNYRVFKDYPQLDITAAQFAQLLGGGVTLEWRGALGRALVAEDPTFGIAGSSYGGTTKSTVLITQMVTSSANNGVAVTSLADATALFATTYLHTLVPGALTSKKTGLPLGVTPDLGTATPPYNIFSVTGQDLLIKAMTPGVGLGFALTSRGTAAAVWGGMADMAMQTPGSIGAKQPVYVAPDPANMAAAVSEMIPNSQGMLLPNPDATASDGVQAYPLTYVEYALVPAQPLLTLSCQPRTGSQALLTSWLDYITGPGQAELPSGLLPLTPKLQGVAQTAIAKAGTSPVTGACATAFPSSRGPGGSGTTGGGSTGGQTPPASTSTTTTTAAATTAPLAQGSGGSSLPSTGYEYSAPATTSTTTATTTAPAPTTTTTTVGATEHEPPSVAQLALAGFHRRNGPSPLPAAVALFGLLAVLTAVVLLVSGLRRQRPGRGSGPGT